MTNWTKGIALLAMVMTEPAFAPGQDTKVQSPTPTELYQALVKEGEQAREVYAKALQSTTDENRAKVRKETARHLGPKFLALAEKYPNDPVAFEALLWVVTDFMGNSDGQDPVLTKALDMLLRNFVKSEKLGRVCEELGNLMTIMRQRLTGQEDPIAFLLAIMEKSPSKEVQAEACLTLACRPLQQIRMAEILKKTPELVNEFTKMFGKEMPAALQKDIEKLQAESEEHFSRFAEKYNGVLSPKRLSDLGRMLSESADKASEAALRNLLAKDDRREVQATAIMQLVKLLCDRGEALWEEKPKEAAKLFGESDSLLVRAAEKYADVPLEDYGNVGKKAKTELFVLRNLSVGRVAPETEGEDQFGKRFNLRDYRGKVVLLDFWSQT